MPIKTKPSNSQSSRPRDWISDDGFFLFGKYAGSQISYVARHDPGYIKWVLEGIINLSDEDRRILQALIDRRGV